MSFLYDDKWWVYGALFVLQNWEAFIVQSSSLVKLMKMTLKKWLAKQTKCNNSSHHLYIDQVKAQINTLLPRNNKKDKS